MRTSSQLDLQIPPLFAGGRQSVRWTELKELLKGTTAFSILSDRQLEQFGERFQLVHYTLGQPVVKAGDEADAFYVVYSGRARVIATNNVGEEVTVGTLTRGNSFGEQGLLTHTPRNFTIRAASDLALLRLDKTDFASLLGQQPGLREYFDSYISEISIRNFLKLCTAFAPLSPQEIRDLLNSMEIKEFASGEPIIREGETGDAFYLLRSGSAEVIKESDANKVLNRLKAGDSFGELALLTGQARAASIITTEPSSVFRLNKTDFDRIIAASPKFKDAIVSIASGYSEVAVREDEASSGATPELRGELPTAPSSEESTYAPRRARRYPALLQLSETDCGPACLSMILRYYGKHVSINRLRDLANVSREGATLHSVAEAAETLGFHTRGIRASYEHLLKVELPAVAHWEGFHYIVLYEATADRVVVADPAIGLRKLSREEFEKGWTGYLLLLTPTEKIEKVEESKTTFGRFLPLLKPYHALLFEIFLASLVLQLFGLATPIFTQVIVDKVLVHKSTSMLNILLIGMMLIAVFQTATSALRVTRPILSIVDLWREFQEINIAFERLNDVFDAKPEEDPTSQALMKMPRIRGHIKFDNVTFRYPTRPDKNALQNVNLEIIPGQTVALVGRSGSGKTTFANMLLRLHQPNEGRRAKNSYLMIARSIDFRWNMVPSLQRPTWTNPPALRAEESRSTCAGAKPRGSRVNARLISAIKALDRKPKLPSSPLSQSRLGRGFFVCILQNFVRKTRFYELVTQRPTEDGQRKTIRTE